jgi:hypothetical protein
MPGKFGDPKSGGAAGGDPKGAGRDSWAPIGDVARGTLGGGGGGGRGANQPAFAEPKESGFQPKEKFVPAANPNPSNQPNANQPAAQVVRQPRTEFIVLFVWREPIGPDTEAKQ